MSRVLKHLGLLCAVLASCAPLARRSSTFPASDPAAAGESLVAPRWLAAFGSDELYGRLSPDGERLLFASDQKGSFDIWIKELRTGELRRLTSHPAADLAPQWEPDGRGVLFVSMRKDAQGDLYRWRDGKLEALGRPGFAESDPVIAPDGSIYFAGGDLGRLRIFRQRGSALQAVTDWGASQPALSPDGALLAYTEVGADQRARVVVQRLADRRRFVVSTADYPAGSAAFSPDGRHLAFVRYYRGAPHAVRQPRSPSSLWVVPLQMVLAGRAPAELMAAAAQLTSDRHQVLGIQWHQRGLVLAREHAGSIDIGRLPSSGAIPQRMAARQLEQLVAATGNPWDRLLVLATLARRVSGDAAHRSRHLAAGMYREQDEFEKARQLLRVLAKEASPEIAALAAVDLARIDADQQVHLRDSGRANRWRESAKAALARLGLLGTASRAPAVEAHRSRAVAELLQRLGRDKEAIDAYERILDRFPQQAALGADVALRLGALFERVRDRGLMVRYYLGLRERFPGQRAVFERAAAAIVRLYRSLGPKAQVRGLRDVLVTYPDRPLLQARGGRRIAVIYEEAGQLLLAAESLRRVSGLKEGRELVDPEAAFELGRVSSRLAKQLRRQGRAREALGFYGGALSAYELVLSLYGSASEWHQRARQQYVRLGLAEAAELETNGELGAAEKRYRRLAAFDDGLVAAHRGVIALGWKRGQGAGLRQVYRKRVERDPSDYVGRYGLAYLRTLGNEIDSGRLEEARRMFDQALALRPQDPFVHLSLGWVAEMRERYLGQQGKGYLEEAVMRYQRARTLNDAQIDPRTEVDLLVNLVNAFVALGGEWPRVKELCAVRRKLNLAPRTPRQRVYHDYACGRAEAATGGVDRALQLFERAAERAGALGLKGLEAELSARMGLVEQQRGNFSAALDHYRTGRRLFEVRGERSRGRQLGRAMAYVQLLAGNDKDALERAKALRRGAKEDSPEVSFIPVAPPNAVHLSTQPFGFAGPAARAALFGIEEIAYQNRGDLVHACVALAQRIRLLGLRAERGSERGRELATLLSRKADCAMRAGQSGLAREALTEASRWLVPLDGKAVEKLDAESLALHVALALNRLELPAGGVRWPAGRKSPRREEPPLLVLRRLEAARQALATTAQAPVLSERLRFSLHTALGRALWLDWRGAASRPERKISGGTSALERLGGIVAPLLEADRLLEGVYRSSEAEQAPNDMPKLAGRSGITASLWRPLSAIERLRWHLTAALNLASLRASQAGADALAKHPSTDLLRQLQQRASGSVELGTVGQVLRAELAYRQRNLAAMQRVVKNYLGRSPLMLAQEDRNGASRLGRLIFRRALALAAELNDGAALLAFSEQEQRRAFVEALVALPLRVAGRKGAPLMALLRAAAAYRTQLEVQPDPAHREKQRLWRKGLDLLAQRVAQRAAALAKALPQVGAMLDVGAFPLAQLRKLLGRGDQAAKVVTVEGRLLLLVVGGDGPVQIRSLGRATDLPARLHGQLRQTLGLIRQGEKTLWLDLGPLQDCAPGACVDSAWHHGELASLWERLDCEAASPVALPGVYRFNGRALSAPLALDANGASNAAGELGALEAELDDKGTLVLADELGWAGRSAADVTLRLAKGGRLALSEALGERLGAEQVVVLSERPSGPGARRKRYALLRLLHGLGVGTVIFGTVERGNKGGKKVRARDDTQRFLAALESNDRASAARKLSWRSFGALGIAPAQRKAVARAALKRAVFAGAAAFRSKPPQLPRAARLLEAALRLSDYLGDKTYLAGALLFAANAHGLHADYARALRRMTRLLRLQKATLDGAVPKKRLRAWADYLKTLQRLAWLELRAGALGAAMTHNQKALAGYQEIRRTDAAVGAYEQRSLIAERQKKLDEALVYAERARAHYRALASRPHARQDARNAAADAGLRVVRLLRRLSRYSTAERVIASVFKELGVIDETRLVKLAATAHERAARAKKQPKDKLLGRQAAQATALQSAAERSIGLRIELLLERGRVASASGVYYDALSAAEQALALSRRHRRSPLQALLELSNNHYYLGAYRAVLRTSAIGLAESGSSPLKKLQFLNARGTALARLGQLPTAQKTLEQALALARSTGRSQEVAATLNNLGDAARTGGDFEAARQRFAEALRIDRAGGDDFGVSFSLTNLAITNGLAGFGRRSEAQLSEALALSTRVGASLNVLKARSALARCALERGDYRAARDHALAGDQVARRTGQLSWLWRFALHRVRALRRLGKPLLAFQHARAAVSQLWESAHRQPPSLLLPAQEEGPAALFDELVALLAARGDAEGAFLWAQRRGQRAFADRLAGGLLELGDGELKRLLERWLLARARRDALLAASLREPGPAWVTQLALAAKEIDTLVGQLVAHRPGLAPLLRPQPAPLSALAKRLATVPGAALVAFYPTRDELVSWVVGPRGVRLRTTPLKRATLREGLAQLQLRIAEVQQTKAPAQRLYRALFKPIAAELGAVKRLYVLPSAELRALPFAVLHDGRSYLVQRFAISYLETAEALVRRAAPGSAGGGESWVSFGGGFPLAAPLSHAGREGKALGQSGAEVRLFQGKDATKAALLHEGSRAAHLHLATHAAAAPDQPLAATLALYDGPLRLAEWLTTPLRARLIVVSACNGVVVGHSATAETSDDLARLLRLGGADAVISALARISDLGAALTIKRLFVHLAAKLAPAVALQAAQRDVAARHRHPAFWGLLRLHASALR